MLAASSRAMAAEESITGVDHLNDRVVMEDGAVSSGVAEIARLQAREGFLHRRP